MGIIIGTSRHLMIGGKSSSSARVPTIISGVSPISFISKSGKLYSLKRLGKVEQTTTPTPSNPVDIKCNNGVLKVRRQSGLPLGYQMVEWLKPNGAIPITGFKTKSTQEITTVFYRESSAATYLYWSDTATSGTTNTTAYLTSAGNWRWDGKTYSIGVSTGITITSVQNKDGVWLNGTKYGYYTNADEFVSTADLSVSSNSNTAVRIYSLTIREGETVTLDLVPVQRLSDSAYGFYDKVSGEFYTSAESTITAGDLVDDPVEIYTDGTPEVLMVNEQTASVEDLIAAGDYVDEQNIISGLLTHKVGIKVFDGTENFTISASGAMITTIDDVAIGAQNTPMNTHFALETSATSIAVGAQRFGANGTKIYSTNYYMKHATITTVADFQSWLTSKYAAGTPVIVLYPLDTPTVEEVTPQQVTAVKGNNTVTSTANVSNPEIEVTYSA